MTETEDTNMLNEIITVDVISLRRCTIKIRQQTSSKYCYNSDINAKLSILLIIITKSREINNEKQIKLSNAF